MADIVTFNENTLFKVKEALEEIGLSDQKIVDAISAMQNRGVLFCERPKINNEDAFTGTRIPTEEELVRRREQAHNLRPRIMENNDE